MTSTSSSTNHYPIASLYVGDLAPEVTEAVLFEKFSIAGPVLSIRVCRDIITRRSLGYAYVNYQNTGDAERAIDTLNFEKLGNRPIRIMWSQRDPSLRRSGVGNIFIKNLERTVDNKVLFDTFSVFGNILSCKVSYDDKSSSKGYGFVHYDSEEAAQDAIENLNNRVILGKKIYVGKFLSRKERECKHGGSRRFTNVYVKNLPDEYNNDDKLKALFDPFGEITSAVVAVDDESKSKGFGFVCFTATEGAESAVDALNGKDFGNGKPLYVGRAQKKAERDAELRRKLDMLKMDRINRSQGVNLYVKNLEDTINDERLQKEFSAFGTITSAKVMTDDKGRSKGFGFVCFSTPEEATKAVTEMNNRIIVTKPLYVALAQRKEDREAQKINLRFGQPAMPRIPPQAGNHPHHPLGAQMGFPPNPAAGPLAIQGLQGQAVHSVGHAGGPQYLVPIAPNAQLHQRTVFPGGAGFQGGAPGQQGMRGNPRWNNAGQMNRSGQVGGPGQYNPNSRGSGIQRNPNQQSNVARQGVFPAGVPNGPGATGPIAGRSFVQGQNMPVNGPNGVQVQRGNIRPPANVAIPRGANKSQQLPINHAILHDASSSEDQSQILGEKLFPHVHKLQPENAGKITGMLLEMDVNEILHMIDSPDNIKAKVDEAVAVLQAHHAKEMAAKKE